MQLKRTIAFATLPHASTAFFLAMVHGVAGLVQYRVLIGALPTRYGFHHFHVLLDEQSLRLIQFGQRIVVDIIVLVLKVVVVGGVVVTTT
jgi:hypothetical protein|tara:strand:- start:4 stop:273 length:270 start_codon:yes stop_codon:yes gene_type:complete